MGTGRPVVDPLSLHHVVAAYSSCLILVMSIVQIVGRGMTLTSWNDKEIINQCVYFSG